MAGYSSKTYFILYFFNYCHVCPSSPFVGFFGQDESSVVAFDEEHQLITLCCKFFFVHMVARLFFSAHSFRLHYEGVLSGGLPVWELHC